MERITCACATKVIPEGKGVKKIILREKITNKSLEIILNGNINGIDIAFFSPEAITETKNELRAKFGYAKDDFIFVFVGRMVKDKGINELVSSFTRLNKVNKQVKLLLVGSLERKLDSLNKATEATIQKHPSIQWVGYQKDVRPYFKVADVLAFPSYREGFPNVVMQAGAMGLPSLVTDINGCNEIIIEGENGIIIPPQNEKELWVAMQKMTEEKEEIERMASNARGLIQTRYEQEKVWSALLEMYQSLDK